jgi:hypothetical protein
MRAVQFCRLLARFTANERQRRTSPAQGCTPPQGVSCVPECPLCRYERISRGRRPPRHCWKLEAGYTARGILFPSRYMHEKAGRMGGLNRNCSQGSGPRRRIRATPRFGRACLKILHMHRRALRRSALSALGLMRRDAPAGLVRVQPEVFACSVIFSYASQFAGQRVLLQLDERMGGPTREHGW